VDRRGKIWGTLVPHGMTDLGFGHRKPSPWRAGANENTVFAVSHDVLIEGQPLAAGRYGLHIMTGPEEWTLIFSKDNAAWGSFFYEESRDALRVKIKPRKNEYREYLTYDFVSRKPEEARVELQWEELAAGWTIRVADSQKIYLSKLREELHNTPGFSWQGWVQAVNYCLQINANYEEALQWADYALTGAFVGQTNFTTLRTKAQVLERLKRDDEAAKLMASAIDHPTATPVQIHQYGRQLLAEKKSRQALEVFQTNFKKNGDAWPVHVGLARGYAAVGDTGKALEHAKKALPQAPDPVNKNGLEMMIKALSSGGSI
jgi:tetratricopeptide (TPR) repeat protein